MDIKTVVEGPVAVIQVSGRLDATCYQDLEKVSRELIAGGRKKLILDFGGLDYMSSAGLRSVLTSAQAAMAAGGSVSLCSLKGVVEEVISMSGFDSFLKIYGTPEEAMKAQS